jgi:uncharacterized membrane protein
MVFNKKKMDYSEEKMILDEEVFAVIIAITIIASVLSFTLMVFPYRGENFIALGLLNENCKIGYYPQKINLALSKNITLCIYVYNHMGKPVVYKVIYKIAFNQSQLPTNTTPSSNAPLALWVGALNDSHNATFLVNIEVPDSSIALANKRLSLVFELWILNTSSKEWIYSGRWNHLWVEVVG